MKDGFIKVAAATPRIRVADPAFNAGEIIDVMTSAAAGGAKLLVLPELCVTGYTCGDLFLQRLLLSGAQDALAKITAASAGLDILCFVGVPLAADGALYNCAAAVYDGELLGVVPKTNIPNYSEFYEKRYFTPGRADIMEISVGGMDPVFLSTELLFCSSALPEMCVAAEICEDLWVPMPPSARHALAGANVIVNLSASDETVAKDEYRRELVGSHSARLVCGYLYADAGAGESTTDVVYAGHDIICENGAMLCQSDSDSGIIFSELDIHRLETERRRLGLFGGGDGHLRIFWGSEPSDTGLTRAVSKTPFVPESEEMRVRRCEKIITLQSRGLEKRMEHSGAEVAVVGVSGGLDSTLALLVARRALKALQLPEKNLVAVTMPCFGTTGRTKSNAMQLAECIGASLRVVDIGKSVMQHFEDIGHSFDDHSVVFENAQARERTQVLMDIANGCSGLVVGTGDMSELALGWATYNGDHMAMYGVNAGVPKTLVRHLVAYFADTCAIDEMARVLRDILDTPVSPELLPAENGEISQKTEDLVGPYELHDFFLYYLVRWAFPPKKVLRLAKYAFSGSYDDETVLKWLRTFIRRFFTQQFKRSCLPDGPKVGTLSLSPRGDWRMPSDASAALWLSELEA